MSADEFAFWLEVAAKAVFYAALLPAIGVCAVRSLLLPRLGGGPDGVAETRAALAVVGTTSVALVLIALALRLIAHTVAVFGLPDALSVSQIRIIALESRWGGGWRLQVFAALALLAASALVRVRPATTGIVPALASVALCYTVPQVGHAAGSPLRVALHGSHVLAAGSWVGSLTVLLFLGLRQGVRPAGQATRDGVAALRLKMLRGFSPVALSGSAVVVFTGAVSSVFYVGSLSNMWTSSYGLLLALKLALVAATARCGYRNWRWFAAEPVEETPVAGAGGPMAATIAIEVLFAAAVVLVTAVLTEVAHP